MKVSIEQVGKQSLERAGLLLGGVSGAEDLRALRKLGMAGAILGKAYYSGAVSIPEALAACADPDGLPPGSCADSDSVRQTADCDAG